MKLKKFYRLNSQIKYLFLFLFILGCSFSGSKFWTDSKKIKNSASKERILFSNKEFQENEFNPTFKINFKEHKQSYLYKKNFSNKKERLNFDFDINNYSKFKLKKNKKFSTYNFNINHYRNGLLIHSENGTVLNFDKNLNLVWKQNIYNKKDKKLSPFLFFNNNENHLIVTDDLANYYLLDMNDGNIIWKKKNSSPFNSQIKIFGDKFFALDRNNEFKCFSISDGNLIWSFKTENLLVKSKKRLSIILDGAFVYFSNSIGDISAVDIINGDLKWQISTQGDEIYSTSHNFEMSDLVLHDNRILLANNRNDFYSISKNNGFINWRQNINSDLDPIIFDNYVLIVTNSGFFVVIDEKNGNILRQTNIFKILNKKNKGNINATGFTVGNKNIYITTDHGELVVADILSGNPVSYYKLSKKKLSNPISVHEKLYLLEESSVIEIN